MHIYRNPNISKVKYQVNNMVSVSEGEGLTRYGDSRRNLPLMPYRGHKCAYFVPRRSDGSYPDNVTIPFVVNDSGYTHICVLDGSGNTEFFEPIADCLGEDGLAYVQIYLSSVKNYVASAPMRKYLEAYLVELGEEDAVIRNSVSTNVWIIPQPEISFLFTADSAVGVLHSDYIIPRYVKIPQLGGEDPLYYKITKYSMNSEYYGEGCAFVSIPFSEMGNFDDEGEFEIGCYAPESDFFFKFSYVYSGGGID